MQDNSADRQPDFSESVILLLCKQNAVVSRPEMVLFVESLERSIRQRDLVPKQLAHVTDRNDIVFLIRGAILAGERDEAAWRCFLAAHFGRTSARGTTQVQSASRLICAFQNSPVWTWNAVSKSPESLRAWLHDCVSELATLAYGNHRKYESHKPERIWSVVESFIRLAKVFGGPAQLIGCDDIEIADPFDMLFRRLRLLLRFGRTGRFDFLVLLMDIGLISAQPKSSYLNGATGPLKGARRLWGVRTSAEYDEAAAMLAQQLKVTPIVVEDALCNWQK